jgi:hypothetical protein
MYKFEGTPKSSWLYGSFNLISSSAPILFDGSIKVISSPNILEIFPLFISSIIRM